MKRYSDGRVILGSYRSLADTVSLIYSQTRPEGGCLCLAPEKRHQGGRGKHFFRGKQHLSHRLVARYYLGPCPEGMEVRHLCGRGHEGCVTASHLRYGTHIENGQDTARHGARKGLHRGETHRDAKLTECQVREIRRRYLAGESPTALENEFGLSRGYAVNIGKGRKWGWLDD